MTDYRTMYECAAEFAHSLILEANSKDEEIRRLEAEIRELKEQAEELRFNPNHDPENGRFTSGNGVDISGGSGIIKESEKFEIPSDKIKKFLLSPGAKHSSEFFAVGYMESDYEQLFYDIELEFDISKAIDIKKNADGTEDFSIFMNLGVSNKKRFRTVWRKDTTNSKPRLITSHRED